MGKQVANMTKREIMQQRERARRNRKPIAYKSRTEKLIEKILAESKKVKTNQAGFYIGVQFAIEALREIKEMKGA